MPTMYVSEPETMLTITGPGCVCQGNRAPGCTMYLTATVRDGSWTLTTVVPPSWFLSLIFMVIWSGKTERGVSSSAPIGGGGSTAADGTTKTAEAAASITSTVPPRSMARLLHLDPLIIDLLLSRRDCSAARLGSPGSSFRPTRVAFTLRSRRALDYGGSRPERRGLPSHPGGC